MDALSYEEKRDEVIAENERAFCIPNYEPLKPGHVMVLPKRYVDRFEDLHADELKDIYALIARFASRIAEEFGEDPLIVVNRGRHSTQPRLHWHIFPSKGGLRELVSTFEGVPRRQRMGPEDLAAMRDRLAAWR